MFWVYLLSCAGLVMFAGLMSGLTLGLMSLSIVDLEVLSKAGTPQDRLNAGMLYSPLWLYFPLSLTQLPTC
jgi:metal transporter CNNM